MYRLMFLRGDEAIILDPPYVSVLYCNTFMEAYDRAEIMLPFMYRIGATHMSIIPPHGDMETFEIVDD